jgi:uncharacterized protein YqiB (DUF1249 family)
MLMRSTGYISYFVHSYCISQVLCPNVTDSISIQLQRFECLYGKVNKIMEPAHQRSHIGRVLKNYILYCFDEKQVNISLT